MAKLSRDALFALGFIPFAEQRVENGCLIVTCPECGAEFRERTDVMGERTSDYYARHWRKVHTA